MYEYFPGNYRWSYNLLLAFAAGGQFGDISMIGPRLLAKAGDDEAWHAEWRHLAGVLEKRARGNIANGQNESASENLFLASLYHTIGEHFIPPSDPRRLEAYGHVLAAFEQARKLSRWPVERVLVPYEGTTLPGYFMPSVVGKGPRPTVIFLCGLDTTKELSFLRVRQHLAERGMNCLALDTPGIGEVLRYQKLPTRFDYEKPVGAAIDYLSSRPDVDPKNIGIIGSSLGGYYVTRAAAFDKRLKAAVAWGVIYDYHAVWERRLTVGGTVAAPSFQLRYITGTNTIEDAMKVIKNFHVGPIGGQVECSFLIVHGAEDQQVPETAAQAMFDAIGSKDKSMKIFSGEEGGAAHCQFDNHLPAMQYVGDWLKSKLA